MKKNILYARKCMMYFLAFSLFLCNFASFRAFAFELADIAEIRESKFEAKFELMSEMASFQLDPQKETSILDIAKIGTVAYKAAEVDSQYTPAASLKSNIIGQDGETIEVPVTSQYYKVGVTLTDEEYGLLSYVVDTEVVSGSVEHKMLIIGVILNRLRSERFPATTVKEILLAPFQFSTAQLYYKNKDTFSPSEKTVKALENVLSGEYEDKTCGALYFCSTRIVPNSWFEKKLIPLFELEGHSFFKI